MPARCAGIQMDKVELYRFYNNHRNSFEEGCRRFTNGHFTVEPTGENLKPPPGGGDAVLGVIRDVVASPKDVNNKFETLSHDMPTLFSPVVSQLIRAFAYMGGNLAMSLDASDVVYQWDSQTMSEIMTSGAEPYYTVIIAVVIMTIAGLSLWMSPVIAYKVAMGQVYESVSSTVSSWAGALVGDGVEFYSAAIASSISNQAERAQAQGQFLGELTRAGTAYDVGKLNALANRIRGVTGIEGNRISSVEGSYGGR